MPDDAVASSRLDRRLRDGLGEVGRAFFNFPSLSDVQRASIQPIAEGSNVLVCAATATGKTEAVIAPMIWRLRQQTPGGASGPRLLAVAPTRALVADLTARLEVPLAQLGWRCAAQTSDFAGAAVEPEVLLTTPESFDSMLVRRLRVTSGEPVGHLLANVVAVFLDEAHCFDSTARGDQFIFLLERLRLLRKTARAKRWTHDAALHVCAASATVHEPHELARRLLGPDARAIACHGQRPIEVLTTSGQWLRLETGMAASELAARLPLVTTPERLGVWLWAALKDGGCRKALVFVPSRELCDRLGLHLRRDLQPHRHIWVEAHHGSLSRTHRQRAEEEFRDQRDAVLVATNTLEVGVDIGDVDVIALLGAPPDTASLLQRIGRGGRRSGLTRLLPLARNAVDAAALASQLVNAAAGTLEPRRRFRRWDVFPQQVISYIRQNRGRGRSPESLKTLAVAAWPAADTAHLAANLIGAWCNEGLLVKQRGRLHLAGAWEAYSAEARRDDFLHSNLSSTPLGRAVRNAATGEVVGHIDHAPEETDTLTLAGRQHRIVRQDEGIVVTPVPDTDADAEEDIPRYRGHRRRVAEPFAAHVRQGCGLGEHDAPLVRIGDRVVWFHFGGELYEQLLRGLYPHLLGGPAIAGMAVRAVPTFDAGSLATVDEGRVNRLLDEGGCTVPGEAEPGRFAVYLPAQVLSNMLAELQLAARFCTWAKTRSVFLLHPVPLGSPLRALLRPGHPAFPDVGQTAAATGVLQGPVNG